MVPSGEPMTPERGLPAPCRDWALFLDIDGTLVDIAPTPGSVRIPPRVLEILAAADTALGGAVALISGRSLADIDNLTHPHLLSAAGQHGAEWRIDAKSTFHQPGISANDLVGARDALKKFATENSGALVEDKGVTLAIHYRLAPDAEVTIDTLANELVAVLPRYTTFKGKAVVEIRPKGVDKGLCVERFLQQKPFAGRVPVYAGDDRTDEDAFAMVRRCGGVAIRVGPPPSDESPTQAHWQCADVPQFTDWLAELPQRIAADD